LISKTGKGKRRAYFDYRVSLGEKEKKNEASYSGKKENEPAQWDRYVTGGRGTRANTGKEGGEISILGAHGQ